MLEAEHRLAAGRCAGNLHGVLYRLGAAVREHRLLGKAAGGERVQPLRERHVRLVHRHMEAGMQVALELPADRVDDGGMAVPDGEDPETSGEVDVLTAVHVAE